MYKDILLPFDGSDGAAAVLHHTAEIAHWDNATIHVLFVADTSLDSVTVMGEQTIDVLIQQGEDIVKEAEKTLQSLGSDYDTAVIQGNPAPAITEYAEQYGYDLIVMPTHGRKGVSRYLLGSVTEKVVRLPSPPVLTARMQPDEHLMFPYENILIPTDGSTEATHAAEHGLALASALNSTVHTVSVVDDTSLGLDIRSDTSGKASEAGAEEAIDDLISMSEKYDINEIVQHIEHGNPAEGILTCIDTNEIDVVVMGTTGRRGTDRILLGSVTEKTVRSAPVPVITVCE